MTTTIVIHIKGLVQGVGFRPFIYRLALYYGLLGDVENRNDGVVIRVQCDLNIIPEFIESIRTEAPEASIISEITSEIIQDEEYHDFHIRKSENRSNEITEVSPDIAVCKNCLEDLKHQAHRINYPLINCTNCGPRFSIIRDLPYDRDKTTMSNFIMCETCHSEYMNVLDRRFHAQPVACNNCGPVYSMKYGKTIFIETEKIITESARIIDEGNIIALKGMGGFQLLTNAFNEQSVSHLRKMKNRDCKPFAVMFRDLESIAENCILGQTDVELLTSWRRPIVILNGGLKLAFSVSNGLKTTGCILPYMPFHHLLFSKLKTAAIVFTSGNISDEPIIIKDSVAEKNLTPISGALVTYNREIHNRTDDSVVFSANNQGRLIRRSRGYVPSPIYLKISADGIIAAGAELSNCFCVGKSNFGFLSQHIGDLKNFETYQFYRESIANFNRLFRIVPTTIACDMHPDYLSTRYAEESGLEIIKIQHHHAHIASCMAELGLDEKVIGVAFDGTGYGDDGNIWGGEFFINDLAGYERKYHLKYISLPGGDKVTDEPWRIAVSVLFELYGMSLTDSELPFLKLINPEKLKFLLNALDKKVTFPLSSGAGRVFDAVAAITGLCINSGFHAEAPMRLESVIDHNVSESYSFSFQDKEILLSKMYHEIVQDIQSGIQTGVISAKFHNTLVNIIFAVADSLRVQTGINKVVLSGGVFQNRYLLEKSENILQFAGFNVYSHRDVPSNDGGIALGQLVIAAKLKSKLCV